MSYELLYFNIPGRGEVHRMVFHYLGKEFNDVRKEFSEWPALKSDESKVPCGFMPVLSTPNGDKIVQSTTILRYLGNEFNLYGKSNIEKSKIDTVIDFSKEIVDNDIKYFFYSKTPEEKAAVLESLDKLACQAFKYYEKIVKENKEGPYFAGKEPTIADIFFLDTITKLGACFPDNKYLEDYPLLKELHEKTIASSPTLKKYMEEKKSI